MKRKKKQAKPDDGPGLLAFVQRFSTDSTCREYLEGRLWPKGPVCAHCGSNKAYALKGKSTRPGLYKCAACRKPFTVTVGTIFERSHVPLPKWFAAIYLMCSSKKGVSAHQIHRSLKVTYRTAWFMCHRIRHAMKSPRFRKTLGGKVEVDETYVGGRPRRKGVSKPGRGTKKTPVVALVSRRGKMRARSLPNVTRKTLKGEIARSVRRDATIYTDEWTGYVGLRKSYKAHETVNHSDKEYVRGDVHVNTAESWFALLKRGVHGTFHHVGSQHLDRYCDEFSFRWNNRHADDMERSDAALASIAGKRLMYREPINGNAEALI